MKNEENPKDTRDTKTLSFFVDFVPLWWMT